MTTASTDTSRTDAGQRHQMLPLTGVVGSAYKGAWVGLFVGLLLAVVEPWSYVASGAAGAGCFIVGALAGAGLHWVRGRKALRGLWSNSA